MQNLRKKGGFSSGSMKKNEKIAENSSGSCKFGWKSRGSMQKIKKMDILNNLFPEKPNYL